MIYSGAAMQPPLKLLAVFSKVVGQACQLSLAACVKGGGKALCQCGGGI